MRYWLILMIILCAPCGRAEPVLQGGCDQTEAAKLLSLQGKLYYDPLSSGSWKTAQLNDNFCEGSRIRLDKNSRASVLLPGGIILRLDQDTVLSLNGINPQQPTLLNLVTGFVHFISRTPKRLQIHTPIANAGPEGTEFALQAGSDNTLVWVYEGKVRLFNTLGQLSLQPGESGIAEPGKAPRVQLTIKPKDAVNWALYYPPLLPYPTTPGSIDTRVYQAITQFRQGRTDTALAALETVPDAQRNGYFYKVRAAMRLSIGRVDSAEADLAALQTLNPQDAEGLALQAIIALTQNRKDQAYALAKQAVAGDKPSATAYSALSYVEQGRFQLEQALAAAKTAVELAPNDAMVWARQAELELSLGKTADSSQSAAKALSLDSQLERTQTVMGFAQLMRMETDAALSHFTQAIERDSSSPLARLGLGLAKIRQGDLPEGRRELEIAAILDPNNSLIRSYLGKAYYEEKRNSLAGDQFGLAKQYDPKDPTPWFYEAIKKQTENRPVEALQDLQKAIELNDNRAVYRSKLMLDSDNAVRSTNLGRIYRQLGNNDAARLLATRGVTLQPNNYNAHELLAEGYRFAPKHEFARASENLQAQLLRSLNLYPIQPQLAYTDLNIPGNFGFTEPSFNEYSAVFNRNQHKITATGVYGSNDTRADEVAVAGIIDRFAYSLGQMHYQTEGFRPNAGLKHDLYNAFAQYQFSPEFSVQAEYRYRDTQHGDIQMQGDVGNFEKDYHRELQQDSYRLGAKYSPQQHSDLLFSFIYYNRAEHVIPYYMVDNHTKQHGLQLESQYIYHNERFNILLGGGVYNADINQFIGRPNYSEEFNSGCSKILCISNQDYLRYQNFGYVYANINFIKDVTATLGVSYDDYNDQQAGSALQISQFSPKLGLQWQLTKHIAFRVAGFQAVKPPIAVSQSLQPVQIAGFNQLFDDLNGSRSTQFATGLDVSFKDWFGGAEVYFRDIKTPIQDQELAKWEEDLYRVYLNWLPSQSWALSSEFRYENFQGQLSDDYGSVKTAYAPVGLRYFHKQGWFVELGGQYVNQSVSANRDKQSFTSNFFLIDASIGYRLPKRLGMISLEAKNLLDKNFRYRDRSYQMSETRGSDLIPERLLFARITLNF